MTLPDPAVALDARRRAALEDEIAELSAHIHAATCRLLVLVREFDRAEGWGESGCRSMAHWLHWRCGFSLRAAREKVRVAHALSELPLIGAAFASGQLSYAKVRAVTRVGDGNNEAMLLEWARHADAGSLEKIVRSYRRYGETAAVARQHARRSCVHYTDDDGCLVIRLRLPAEEGSVVLKAVEAAMAELDGDPEDGSAEPPGDDENASCSENGPAGPRPMAEHFQVHVHLDLRRERHRPCCDPDSPGLSEGAIRRLGCEASLVGVVHGPNGEILSVGRKTRAVPPPIRRALKLRDGGCRFPGCTNHRHVDAHHVVHWADGGETRLSNLVLLCRRHHRLVHEGGFGVNASHDGRFVFTRPDGSRVAAQPRLPAPPREPLHRFRRAHREHGITARTPMSLYDGAGWDLDLCIAALDQAARQAGECGSAGPFPASVPRR